MKVYLKDHHGQMVIENATKVEFAMVVTKDYAIIQNEKRILIYVNDKLTSEFGWHPDDIVKIEEE